jgi:hypothetical protein
MDKRGLLVSHPAHLVAYLMNLLTAITSEFVGRVLIEFGQMRKGKFNLVTAASSSAGLTSIHTVGE